MSRVALRGAAGLVGRPAVEPFPGRLRRIVPRLVGQVRFVAVLALHLFGEKTIIAEPLVKLALNDEHGSVRQAAHILLKSFNSNDLARAT